MDKNTEKVYFEYRNHLIETRRQSYEQFDKAIFFLSGGGLAVSLTILEAIVPLRMAQFKIFLIFTWILFTTPLLLTLLSFIVSRRALDKQLQYADDFFVKGQKNAFDKKNVEAQVTECLNFISGTSFCIGVISLLLFVSLNIF